MTISNTTCKPSFRLIQHLHRKKQFGYVIRCPGTYIIDNQVLEYKPSQKRFPNTIRAAIAIRSSDVRLVIRRSTLAQAKSYHSVPPYTGDNVNNPKHQVPFVSGIYIPDPLPNDPNTYAVGYNNIFIEGEEAVFRGFSQFGISAAGHIANLKICGVRIEDVGFLASFYYRPANYIPNGAPGTPGNMPFAVAAIRIGESDVLGLGPEPFTQKTGITDPTTGLYLGTAQNRVQNVELTNVFCYNNFSIGLLFSNIQELKMKNVHADKVVNDDPNLWAINFGFALANVQNEKDSIYNAVLDGCTGNQCLSLGDFTNGPSVMTSTTPVDIFGFAGNYKVNFSKNVEHIHCNFDELLCNFNYGSIQAPIFGNLYMGGTNQDFSFQNCSFSDTNTITDGNGLSQNIHITGFDFQTNTTAILPGFANIVSPSNIKFKNCRVRNLTLNNQLGKPTVQVVSNIAAIGIQHTKNLLFEDFELNQVIANGPVEELGGIQIQHGESLDVNPLSELNGVVLRRFLINQVQTNQGGQAIAFASFNDAYTANETSRNIILDQVVVQNCSSNTSTEAFAIPQAQARGFYVALESPSAGPAPLTSFNEYIKFIRCIAQNIQGISTIGPGFLPSAGFVFENDNAPAMVAYFEIEECESFGNNNGFVSRNLQFSRFLKNVADNNVATISTITADNGVVGTGFLDFGPSGTTDPTAISPTNNVYEVNRAYNNGPGTSHTGVNSNFNVIVATGVPVPLLQGQISTSTYVYVAPTAPELPNIRNISTIL